MEIIPFHSGGAGEPMVLLHGFTNCWRAWGPVPRTWKRRMRAIGFAEVVARPSRLSPSLALATFEAAGGCRVVDELLDLVTSGQTVFADLGRIECPVTIVTASRDRLLKRPSYFVRFRQMVPEAEWVVMDGVGHMPMSDDPDGVANLILSRSGAE